MLGKGLVRVGGRSDDGQVVRCTSGESQSELDSVGRETCFSEDEHCRLGRANSRLQALPLIHEPDIWDGIDY